MMKQLTKHFALCIDNAEYGASLIRGKVYRPLPDPRAAKDDFVRIVDESGEDYLYHKSHFVFVYFPKAVKKKLLELESAPNRSLMGTLSTRAPHGLISCRNHSVGISRPKPFSLQAR